MQKITPFLWFDDQAEEAMNFYVSIFINSKVVSVSRYGEGGPRPKGTAMIATFQINGQDFMALNGSTLNMREWSPFDRQKMTRYNKQFP